MTFFWLFLTDDGDDDDGLDDDFDKIDSATVSTPATFRTDTVTGHSLPDVFTFSVNNME
jgi:hypothetical protein